MADAQDKEFVFIDESGDPGPHGSPMYILAALHVREESFPALRHHLTAFRYHTHTIKEFKDGRWADKPMREGDATHRLLDPVAQMKADGALSLTGTWMNKKKYISNGGPHLAEGPTCKFRHFQLRILLERHRATQQWGTETDLVIDRWLMTREQRADLETYLKGNFKLRPSPEVTLVDSLCCDPVQVVDIVTRLVKRCVTDRGNEEELALCERLIDLSEVTRGLY